MAAAGTLSPGDVRKPAGSTGSGALAAEADDTDQLLETIPSFDHLMSGGPAQGGGNTAAADLGPEADGGDMDVNAVPHRSPIGDDVVMETGEATLGHVVAEAGANPFAESGGSASIRHR